MFSRPRLGNKRLPVLIFLLMLILAGAFLLFNRTARASGSESLPETVDFNYHIRPILSDRCFKCHGPDASKREAGLRLDTEEGAFAALKDNPSAHVIVPNNPLQSELYLRISSPDTSYLMPPPSSNLKLNNREIRLLEKWIRQGARFKKHWAFLLPQRSPIPDVEDRRWPVNEIDYFILSALEKKGLEPNGEADKERLLRRVCFDLTGLPPGIELQDRFMKDHSPGAYEKIVDELLASPHYGEKMAVSWLDLSRYADSHGYQDDGLRTMWPWRDWVIHAFNKNYSYKDFVQWQLAGDLFPNASLEQQLASGFNRNHKITQEGGVIDEEYRIEYVTDRTNTFSKAFLALTFECAKCHDHKYDPVTQKDYYSTFAFFNQVAEKGYQGDITLASLGDPPNIRITTRQVDSVLTFINKKDTAPVTVMVMRDTNVVRATRVLKRGVYDQPGDTVGFSTPAAILPFDTLKFQKNRYGLAQWLFEKNNPLTARVYVNRVWQEIFGRGLVKTSGDFGMQGELPTHPELLDWLALEFSEKGWDIKNLVKTMVMSATYRQSAIMNKKNQSADPENIYFSRHSRIRLSAEEQRDEVLYSGGLLVPEIGGPSVKTYQPKGIWEASTSGRGQLARYVQDHGESLYRRSMYTFIKRTVPPPAMLVFDGSNRDQCEVKRARTNTPLQALVLLNDPQVLESSRVLAQKLLKENSGMPEKIEKAFRLIVSRRPDKKEMDILQQYFSGQVTEFQNNKGNAGKFIRVGEYPLDNSVDPVQLAALMQVIHTMYNMDESETKS